MAKAKPTKEMFQFDLIDVRLIAANFSICAIDEDQENVSIDTKLTVDHALIDEGITLRVSVTASISGSNSPFTLDATMGGLFRFHSEITDAKQVEYIAEINCASIIFPFLRETVADITRRAGYAPLLLPPVNFVEIYQKEHSPKATS